MKILLVVLLALFAPRGEGKQVPSKHEPETHVTNQQVLQGVKLVKDLVTLTKTPTIQNMFTVTPQLGPMGIITGLAGAAEIIGGIADIIFPDDTLDQVKRMFRSLQNEIANVREDIRRLEEQIDWANTQLQYTHVVNVITTATDLAEAIAFSTSPAEKQRRQERFVEHCRSQGLQMSVNVLYNGLTGRGYFQTNILASYYRVSRGHAPNMVKLGSRLLNVATGGLMALMSYESLVRGRGGAEDMAKDYQPRMLVVGTSTQANVQLCITNYKANLNNDLTTYLTGNAGKANNVITSELYAQMTGKFPWLNIAVAAYNKRESGRRHRYRVDPNHGSYRIQFTNHRKNTYVFYVDKNAPFVGASKVGTARSVLSYDNRSYSRTWRRIEGGLASNRIATWALIVCENSRSYFALSGNAGGRVIHIGGRRNQKLTFLQ